MSSTSDHERERPNPRLPDVGSDLFRIGRQWSEELDGLDVSPFLLAASIQRLSTYVEREFTALAKQHGLGAGDMRILLVLRRSGPDYALRPTELFRRLLITSGAVSKQVDRLIERKLVRRSVHADDNRIQMVCLEPGGREIADDMMRSMSLSLCGFQNLDATDTAMTLSALTRLLAASELAEPERDKTSEAKR